MFHARAFGWNYKRDKSRKKVPSADAKKTPSRRRFSSRYRRTE